MFLNGFSSFLLECEDYVYKRIEEKAVVCKRLCQIFNILIFFKAYIRYTFFLHLMRASEFSVVTKKNVVYRCLNPLLVDHVLGVPGTGVESFPRGFFCLQGSHHGETTNTTKSGPGFTCNQDQA